MGEFQKKWFQIVWACLLIASITITYIQRWVNAAWAHSAAMDVLDAILTWITFPLTVILFVLLCVELWRKSERLFWRRWRRWGGAIAAGIVLAVILLLMMRFIKGDSVALEPNDKRWIVALFSIGMLIWVVARYKFKHWRRDR